MENIYVVDFECKQDQEYQIFSEAGDEAWTEETEIIDNGNRHVTLKSFEYISVRFGDVEIRPVEKRHEFLDMCWCPQDVLDVRPDMSPEGAAFFLLQFDDALSYYIKEAGKHVIKEVLDELPLNIT